MRRESVIIFEMKQKLRDEIYSFRLKNNIPLDKLELEQAPLKKLIKINYKMHSFG